MTSLDGIPVTTTSATYTRSMPNIVALGPSFRGQKDNAHIKHEYMDLADLMTHLEIYALATYELAKKKNQKQREIDRNDLGHYSNLAHGTRWNH